MYSPLPFRWTPGDGQRHATREPVAEGAAAEALCGEGITASFDEISWFWSTCARCNELAHELAAVPMPDSITTDLGRAR
ncbi:zinc finger protein [Saccharopolyspora tripterygii]